MYIKEFTALAAEEILAYLREEGEDDVTVQSTELMKMNDQALYGLTFQRGDEPAPTYYLNEMYSAYFHGVDLEKMLRDLVRAYRDTMTEGPMPTEIPDLEYGKIKERAGVRLLGMDYNRHFLKTVPYREVGNGYALVCEVHIGASDGGLFSTIVTNDMAEEYHYNMKELFDIALENEWQTNPASFSPLGELLGAEDEPKNNDEKEACYVLTTKRQKYGAAALFYPGTQEMIARVLEEDYLALPSSLHEFLILRESEVKDLETLRRMVLEANRVVVSPEDVLSDSLLYFSISTGELSQVLPEEVYADFAG